ncbi:MAG: 8-oxo-dGTP diphosphatase [bacterium]|nr:8-oxo-dGTP diphosphatase [bacterium]
MRLTTLCFLIRGNEVLLAMKKRGFGVGKFNGVGGKVSSGEAVLEAMIREAEEEIGVKIDAPEALPRAKLLFYFDERAAPWTHSDADMARESKSNYRSLPLRSSHRGLYFDGKPDWNQECHVFIAKKWQNEPTESDEMKPQWFPMAQLPFEKMWIDDPHWLPKFLAGKSLEAEFHFNATGYALLSRKVIMI